MLAIRDTVMRARRRVVAMGTADFVLSTSAGATNDAGGNFANIIITNAPAGAYIVLVEGAGATGDEAGFAVVNG